jgi:single-strand DNA-binding protein
MPSLNKTFLMGRLTRDVELRYTTKGTAVAELSLAINRVWSDENGQKQEETTFVEVTLWARTAEIAAQYLQKGSTAFIEGRLQLDVWEDKQTGQKRSKLRVIGENLQLVDTRSSHPESAPSQETQAAVPRRAPPDPHLDIEEPT